MLRLNRGGLCEGIADSELLALRGQFEAEHHVHLRGFLAPEFLSWVLGGLRQGREAPKKHGAIGEELCVWDTPALDVLTFAVNDSQLFSIVSAITGCGSLGCFEGRVYRMHKEVHHDSWHHDLVDDRKVAMSINLSEGPYEGGATEIREHATGRTWTAPNATPGDALLFRLDPALEHRVLSVTGDSPKTAYAGWFRGTPRFSDVVRGKASW